MSAFMLLKFGKEDDALKGETKLAGDDYVGGIDVDSCSFSVSCAPTIENGEMRGGGRPTLQDLSLTKKLDKTTVGLIDYCMRGGYIDSATLYLLDNRSTAEAGTENEFVEVMTYTLTHVYIGHHSISFAGDYATETFTLTYAHIGINYTNTSPTTGDQSEVSNLKANWDLLKNKAVAADAA